MSIRSAKGTLLKRGDGESPEEFTTIGQVRSIAGPTTTSIVQDVTTHSTSGNWMEKLAVLLDPGTMSFPINYDSADEAHAFLTGLWADMILLTERNFECLFAGSVGLLAFGAFFTGHGFDLPVDNVIGASIELTITGTITATQPA